MPRFEHRVVSPLALLLVVCNDPGQGEGTAEPGDTTTTTTSSGEDTTPGGTTTTGPHDTTSTTGASSTGVDSTGPGLKLDVAGVADVGGDCYACSADLQQVLDCRGFPVERCSGTQGCDAATGTCIDACQAAENNQASIGCEYFPTFTRVAEGPGSRCFAAYVANIWSEPAHVEVLRAGLPLPVEDFSRIPSGAGPGLSYAPYDAAVGLLPGQVLIVFLSDATGGTCPVTPATGPEAQVLDTGIGDAFQIVSDVPVVAYQMNPYGGGSAAATGASLLLPTSVWDTNYILVNAQAFAIGEPTANLIAAQDGTTITILPNADIEGGGGVPAATAGVPVDIVLDAGQHLQLQQVAALTGSIVQSDAPIGLIAGNTAMQVPVGTAFADHGEQMIPPIRALGHEYVAVMHRPRAAEPSIWRVIGVVDGTTLGYSQAVGGPATIDRGEQVDFITDEAFIVQSQDADHPFMLFNLMSGSQWPYPGLFDRGDPDIVISVPPDQYLRRYVFFADPTYPTTSLVIVRRRNGGVFHPVELDCAGIVGGWTALGADYEWTYFDLIDGDFQPNGACTTGAHQIESDGHFGLWIWGWGTPDTSFFTANVSYGYPGGMSVAPLNEVVIRPEG